MSCERPGVVTVFLCAVRPDVRTENVQVSGSRVVETTSQAVRVAHLAGPVCVELVITTSVCREHQEGIRLQYLIVDGDKGTRLRRIPGATVPCCPPADFGRWSMRP